MLDINLTNVLDKDLLLIAAGVVDVADYVNSLTTVAISWSDFDSNIPVFFYYVGITSSRESASNLNCQSVLSVRFNLKLLLFKCKAHF